MISAAHCVYDDQKRVVRPSDIQIFLGEYDIFDAEKRIDQVDLLTVHENYDSNT